MDILKHFFKQIWIFLLIFLSYSHQCATIECVARDRQASNVIVRDMLPHGSITEQLSRDSDINTIPDTHCSIAEQISDNSVSGTPLLSHLSDTFVDDPESSSIFSEIDSLITLTIIETSNCCLLNALKVFEKIDLPLLEKVSVELKRDSVSKCYDARVISALQDVINGLSRNLKLLRDSVVAQITTWYLISKDDLINMSRVLDNMKSIEPEVFLRLKIFHFIVNDDLTNITKEFFNSKSGVLVKLLRDNLIEICPKDNFIAFKAIERHYSTLNYMNLIIEVLGMADKISDGSTLSACKQKDANINYKNLYNNFRNIQNLIQHNNQLLIQLKEALVPEISAPLSEDLFFFNQCIYYDNLRFLPKIRKVARQFYHLIQKKYFLILDEQLKSIPIFDDSMINDTMLAPSIDQKVISKLFRNIKCRKSVFDCYEEKDFIAIQYIDVISNAFIGSPVWQLDEIGRALKRFSKWRTYFTRLVEPVRNFLYNSKQAPCRIFTLSYNILYSDLYLVHPENDEFLHWKCINAELLDNKFKKEISRMDINSAEDCLRLIFNNIDLLFNGEYFTWFERIFESLDHLYYYLFKKDKEISLNYDKISPHKREKILLEL